jgi:hypothetical protein
MPIHLPPISRRAFLIQAALVAAAGCQGPHSTGSKRLPADPDSWALFSDTHIAADRAMIKSETCMASHLEQAANEVLALAKRPAGVLVNGDCALLKGEAADYATFASLLKPLRTGGLPLWCALGNHDDREHFRQGVAIPKADPKAPNDRHVAVIAGRRFNWFVLDSLDVTNQTPGFLGEAQLAWLQRALEARADKPAVVIGHHNIEPGEAKMGLRDSKGLLDLIESQRHVKAYIFGHTHTWKLDRTPGGVHLVNLPPVAYVFNKQFPSGWVHARFDDAGVQLTLRSLNPGHPQDGQTVDLRWRTA